MTDKTKKVLEHLGISAACAGIGAGCYFLTQVLYNAAARSKEDAWKLLGWFVTLVGLCMVFGIVIHLLLLRANTRVHCKKCGAMANLESVETLKRNMVPNGHLVKDEKVRLNMKCPACGETFALNKKFTVSTYNSKHGVWKVRNLSEMITHYSQGKAWF